MRQLKTAKLLFNCIITGFILFIISCGQSKEGELPALGDPGAMPGSGQSSQMAHTMQAIDNLELPDAIPDSLAVKLKAELKRVLESQSPRFISSPPSGVRNQVMDLALNGTLLSWSYLNTGDYDQNSEVNIADITPIGLHFLASQGSPGWKEAILADGDSNGEVNIADITPIG